MSIDLGLGLITGGFTRRYFGLQLSTVVLVPCVKPLWGSELMRSMVLIGSDLGGQSDGVSSREGKFGGDGW